MVKNRDNLTKAYLLRSIPPDVYKTVILRQAQEKVRLNRNVSIEHTIYRIIRESIKKENEQNTNS